MKDYRNGHYNNRYGVLHRYDTSSSELVLLLDTKQGQEKEMVKGLPDFMEDLSTGYCDRENHGDRCESEHECICIHNVIPNKSLEPFFNGMFRNRVFKMITCTHVNPDENHDKAFLLLSTIIKEQCKIRLAAIEKKFT